MTFDEWFNEQEGYTTRGDRFDGWMSHSGDAHMGKDWLLAAYNAGFRHATGQYSLSNLKRKDDADNGAPTPPYVKYPTPSYPNPVPPPFTPNPWPNVKSCSKCGLSLEGVMGYVCNDMKCPTFKHTWSGTITSGGGGSAGAGAMGSANIYGDIKR